MRLSRILVIVLAGTLAASCAPVTAVGVKLLYRKADLPASRVVGDLCYAPAADCDGAARRLDLYLPAGKDWPVIVFIHGGGWNEGDKRLRVGGADVYSNVGRFYAQHGIGVAVINYRLQPSTDWRGQIEDSRRAAVWVRRNIQSYGGRPDALFLMGHSAGAYLASFVALDSAAADSTRYRGVIAVSGAGLDLTDAKTYELGERPRYYEQRFRDGDSTEEWKRLASPIGYASRNAPPFLILHAGGEKPALKRQSQLLNEALERHGVESRIVVVPGESHSRIVLTLSRADKTAGPAILEFVNRHATAPAPP